MHMVATVASNKSHEWAGDGFDNSFWLGCAVGVHERCSKRSMVFAVSSRVKQSKSTGPGEANMRGPIHERYPGMFPTHEQPGPCAKLGMPGIHHQVPPTLFCFSEVLTSTLVQQLQVTASTTETEEPGVAKAT